jgi:hypothetical protein
MAARPPLNVDLDCEVILAAQAGMLADAGEQPVIATTNVRHLGLCVGARPLGEIFSSMHGAVSGTTRSPAS